MANLSCADKKLEGASVSVMFHVTTWESRETPTCRTGPAEGEARFGWVAPKDGTFVFDTARTPFDSVLTLQSTCGGTPLACAEGGISYGGAARLVRKMHRGEAAVVTVDGAFIGSAPAFPRRYVHLHINELVTSEAGRCDDDADNDADDWVDCADPDCRQTEICQWKACVEEDFAHIPVRLNRPDDTITADGFVGTCSTGRARADHAVRFTAPEDGEYWFHARRYERDEADYPIVYLLDACRGHELACAQRPPARLHMKKGQWVIVVVESDDGHFVLIDRARSSEPWELCGDDFDNDADGVTDLNDPDCLAGP